MARPQQNWGLLTLLTRWASIWTTGMPNTASPKSEPPCGRAVYTPVRATILGHPPQKTAPGGHLFCAISSFVHDFIAIGEFKLNRAPLLSNIRLCASFLHHMWIQTGVTFRKWLSWVMTSVTLTFCMDITSVNGNNSWKFQDDTMTGTLSTRPTLKRRTTLGRHRSIKLNMINHFANQSQTCELLKSIFF